MIKKYAVPLTLVFLAVLFWFFASRGLDPDFGWHLRMGELILSYGIPATDPFSYSMPTYPFVDHEWLTNMGIATLYPKIGFNGLIVIFVAIAFLAFVLQIVWVKKKYIFFPLLLSGITLVSYLGIRPQIQSWFLASCLILLFLHEKLWQKLRFFVPLLMLLWVNLHGSFAFGIGLITIYVLMKQLQSKKVLVIDWIILVCSIAATFVTPYFWRSWWEVWMQMTDTGLRWSIQEWNPVFFFFNVGFIFFCPLSVVFVLRYRKKIAPLKLVLYSVLLFFGTSSSRHLPFWLLIAIPVTTEAIEYFVLDIQKIPFAKKRLYTASVIFFLIFALTFATQAVINFSGSHQSRFLSYPDDAIDYLRTHPSKGNLFNHYNWGGYLIWKYPEKKVFIDGRMPSWREKEAPKGLSNNAFKEYQEVMNGKTNPKKFFKKYHIDTVMVYSSDEPDFPKWLQDGVEKLLGIKYPNQKSAKNQLEKSGMKIVYKDQTAVIYRYK